MIKFVAIIVFFCSLHIFAQVIKYVDPVNGNDNNSGVIGLPYKTLAKGITAVGSNGTIYLRGGTYALTSKVVLSRVGTLLSHVNIYAYANEVPVFDFTGNTSDGFSISGAYYHIKGIEVKKAGHNGINISGDNNTIENCKLYDNTNTGLHITGGSSGTTFPANNLILNCDAYLNYDPPIGGNADGFSAKWNCGTGNVFKGCRAYNNSDDGWDLWMCTSTIVIDSCFAYRNGIDVWFSGQFNGNGNGIKLGGNYVATPHIVRNSIAFDNPKKGFDENNNMAGQTLYNCTGYRNGSNNFALYNTGITGTHTVKNCISYIGSNNVINAVQAANSWTNGMTATAADFVSIDTALANAPRSSSGSLPNNGFLRLAAGSQFIDAGVSVGLPYSGSAPDMGAYESIGVLHILPAVQTASADSIGYHSIKIGGSVTDSGSAAVTARGICWSTDANPDTTGNHTVEGSGIGAFNSTITGLTPGTLYHFRPYATSIEGTAYGADSIYTTLALSAPKVITASVSLVGMNSAVSGGNVQFDGGAEVTAYGVCWSITANPTIADTKTIDGVGLGSYSSNITNLTSGTTYHVRAYATNAVGTSYGADITFTTASSIPVVSTGTINNIMAGNATGGGTVISGGGAEVTARGVCWSRYINPTLADNHTSDGSGTGVFTSSLTNLQDSTTYHIRAYAVSASGIGYGEDVLFSTSLPTVPVSCQWPLTANQLCVNTGNISGTSQVLSSGGGALSMVVNNYNAGSTGNGQRLNLGSTSWPNETAMNEGRYVQFSVAPGAGGVLQVQSLGFTYGYSGTSYMKAVIRYSTDNWNTWTFVDSIVCPNSSASTKTLTLSTITIDATKILSFRFYPYYGSTPSTTKYFCLKNVTISGSSTGAVSYANITLLPQGLYNPVSNSLTTKDTVTVLLANAVPPYAAIDSSIALLDSATGTATATFRSASSGSYYYIIKHRNSVETWSKDPISFTNTAVHQYSYTDSLSKAFGNNTIRIGNRYCMYSGDVNNDGFIDFSDLTAIDNDAYNFTNGFVKTDLNGDQFVDFSDLTICDNNAYNFVGVIKPGQSRTTNRKINMIKSRMF